jgi:hypothetical protein
MKKTEQTPAGKQTLRQAIALINAADELKSRGNFLFRCTVAGLAMEAKHHLELFNEAIKPSKGMQAFQEALQLHKENCTSDKEGKKKVDVEAYMPLYEGERRKHAKAIDEYEKVQEDSNKRLDLPVELTAKLIPYQMLLEADAQEPFNTLLLSSLLPFVEEKI